jgi:putative transposase
VNELCRAAGVSRAGYYRCLARPQPKEAAMDLRSQIQRVALRWPAYGYRRVHAELLRQGWAGNHKRILRLMRADNLLCLRRRKFILTTDSKHGLPIYPNLAGPMVLTGIDQLWVTLISLRIKTPSYSRENQQRDDGKIQSEWPSVSSSSSSSWLCGTITVTF